MGRDDLRDPQLPLAFLLKDSSLIFVDCSLVSKTQQSVSPSYKFLILTNVEHPRMRESFYDRTFHPMFGPMILEQQKNKEPDPPMVSEEEFIGILSQHSAEILSSASELLEQVKVDKKTLENAYALQQEEYKQAEAERIRVRQEQRDKEQSSLLEVLKDAFDNEVSTIEEKLKTVPPTVLKSFAKMFVANVNEAAKKSKKK